MVCLIGCAGKTTEPVSPIPASPPSLVSNYEADTHRTWGGCGSTTNSGHGTVKNIGGSDAIGCYVDIVTDCNEAYSVWVHPRNLAPGQYGEFQTGPFNGRQGYTKLTPRFEGK